MLYGSQRLPNDSKYIVLGSQRGGDGLGCYGMRHTVNVSKSPMARSCHIMTYEKELLFKVQRHVMRPR